MRSKGGKLGKVGMEMPKGPFPEREGGVTSQEIELTVLTRGDTMELPLDELTQSQDLTDVVMEGEVVAFKDDVEEVRENVARDVLSLRDSKQVPASKEFLFSNAFFKRARDFGKFENILFLGFARNFGDELISRYPSIELNLRDIETVYEFLAQLSSSFQVLSEEEMKGVMSMVAKFDVRLRVLCANFDLLNDPHGRVQRMSPQRREDFVRLRMNDLRIHYPLADRPIPLVTFDNLRSNLWGGRFLFHKEEYASLPRWQRAMESYLVSSSEGYDSYRVTVPTLSRQVARHLAGENVRISPQMMLRLTGFYCHRSGRFKKAPIRGGSLIDMQFEMVTAKNG